MRIIRFERRIIAYCIDFIIPIILSLALFFFWMDKYQWPWLNYVVVLEIIASFLYTIINTIICYVFRGSTFGGLIVKSRVIPLTKERISLKNSFVRHITLSVFPFVVINILFMLTVHTERSIFDRLSDTIVVEASA